ncbi:MAG: flagellar hook-associated protein FlgK, partial [Pirellulales bacterium]|nr:flagellar hook-associated protein FlgK [Pirellulales bacterium]
QGETLTTDINRMAERVVEMRSDLNDRVISMADDINRLTNEIAVLNVRIAEAEGGNVSNSDAVGLRDQRLMALEDLASIINISVTEQLSGGVAVYSGGDYLVFEGTVREVQVVSGSDRGLAVADIEIVETAASLDPTSGELHGLIQARDAVFGDYLDNLNDLAGTLAFEFNKVYSSGQGLNGYEELTSTFNVNRADEPLNQTGLDFTPSNGSFQVLVHNKKTGLTQTSQIIVDLNGMGDDMTLDDLSDALNDIDGISAEITSSRGLKISSTGANQEIAFAEDTSGVLAALGLNTFFTGSDALDIGINSDVKSDPSRFAASRGGIGADTDTAIELANFIDRPLSSKDDATLAFLYDRMVSDATQGSTIAKSIAEGARVFEATLRGQKAATSGVNLDEEAIKMLAYQRSFQASSRMIATINELFEVLVNI